MGRCIEVRRAAVRYRLRGNTVEDTCDSFGISKKELNIWVKLYKKTGDVAKEVHKQQFKKIDPDVLKQILKENPNITKKELAQKFDCRITSIEKALVRIGYKDKLKVSDYVRPEPMDIEKLREYIETHPEATVREVSLAFDRTSTVINRAIKKYKLPYKKNKRGPRKK